MRLACSGGSCQCTISPWTAGLNAEPGWSGVFLTWSSHPQADNYIVTRSQGGSSCPPPDSSHIIVTTPGTAFIDMSAVQEVMYVYGVYATNSCNAVSACGGIAGSSW